MKQILFLLSFVLLVVGCSVKQDNMALESGKLTQLTANLSALSPSVDYKEARLFAYEALWYPHVLAQRYGLVSPPTFHNLLINMGLRDRGLCYQWSEDMITHLKALHYQSFDLRWGVANKGELDEHNTVVVVAKGEPFESGILIDPWRNSGELYWVRLKDDPEYHWVENRERSHYYGMISSQ